MPPADLSVEIDHVTKRFDGVTAVDEVTLAIRRGEFFALLGPSGCGKTTLLRMIAGLEEPDEGAIRISGEDVTRVPPHRRPVNMVFQQYALFPHLTVEQNVAFGLPYKALPRSDREERVAATLRLVRLTGLERRRPDQLSGGQRQRVALARALVLEPQVLLLDEPLAALDPNLRREVQVELKGLQRTLGITFVFVTHDREEALALSDRIAVMDRGQVEQVGSPVEVFETPETEFVARFLGATNVFTGEIAGETVRFVVRPEKLALRAAPSGGETALPVTVVDRVYHGASTEWIVEDSRGERFTVLAQNAVADLPFPPGSTALLSWDARHRVALRR
ncbi:MAG: spermidine/putrescine transport system ATP-binding protein [Acidobacteriota bacterium]|jgi:putative spermidine/putrescine transport system ATP-binding protein|nr:spermidine/putrescine transport system ATP-binding protein [Acidobacteriota bacterium]